MPRTEDSLLAKQAETTAQQLAGPAFDPVEMALPEPLVAVPVRDEPPAQAIPRCVTLSAANPVLPLLPQDPRRRRAVLLAVDNDVWVAGSLELAQNAQGAATGSAGFYLPRGVAVAVMAKAAFWCALTSTTPPTSGGASTPAQGAQTNPGAFATIAATNSLPPGTYRVTATVYLSGTVTTADANNMEFFGNGATTTVKIAYPGVANTPVTMTALITTTAAGAIGVQSIGAASGVSAVYNAAIVVDAVSVPAAGPSRVSVLVEKDDI